jgi:hypothetical protein
MRSKWKKSKAIPVIGRGDLQGCEISKLLHFLENQHTDGGEVVSLTRRPPFTYRKVPGKHFCQRLCPSQDHSEAGKIRLIEKSN